ncbi:MAG: glycosyltransferase family 39 protein [bacterium]|nr:glycosyltransferase family 39 protein [bacterium]
MGKRSVFLIFLLITAASIFLRFYNFQDAINFHLDPPVFMHEMKDMVDFGKLRLTGPMVSSKILEGRGFFTGPTMYYILIPIAVLTNWNVEILTGFFAFIWLICFILLYLWLKNRFGATIALIVYGLVSFFPPFVPFSRITWNPTFIPLFALLLLIFLEKRKQKTIFYFLAGLSFGLGLSIEYIAILQFLVLLYYLILDYKGKSFRIVNWFLIVAGFLVGEAPIILFELKHNFYNLQTILFHLRYYESSQSYGFDFGGHFYYYVFPLFPVFCVLYAKFLVKIQKKLGRKIVIISQALIMVLFLSRLAFGPRGEALIFPEGWTVTRQRQIAQYIVQDNPPENFEVAATIGPETRANEIRWWLRMLNRNPMSVVDYEKTDYLYLVAPKNRPPEKETVWEVKVLRPFKVVKQIDLGTDIFLYKLVRVVK